MTPEQRVSVPGTGHLNKKIAFTVLLDLTFCLLEFQIDI